MMLCINFVAQVHQGVCFAEVPARALPPAQASEQDLWALFAPIGDIVELYVLRQKETGRSQGCAFVSYATRDMAEAAITALNGYGVPGGKRLLVKYCDRSASASRIY